MSDQDDAEGFTAAERAAMKERAAETKAARKRRGSKVDPEPEVLAKIAEMPEPDRSIGQRLHELVRAAAPSLTPRLWYGMPAYAKDGKVLCFFQPASKFDARYATLGFQDVATLDEGVMWPVTFALTELGPEQEEKVTALVVRAVG
jgi:uncharacterized protein YdhG (YjbR/CyaY superfamily)